MVLLTRLFTLGKQLCVFSVRLEDPCFKNPGEEGLKLLSFLLRSGSILLESRAAAKPGAGYLLLTASLAMVMSVSFKAGKC